MANVLTILKLVPSDTEKSHEDLINESVLPKCKSSNIEFLKFDKEPLAFGMFALMIYVKNIDSEEGAENLNNFQEELEASDDFQSLELQQQTLIDY